MYVRSTVPYNFFPSPARKEGIIIKLSRSGDFLATCCWQILESLQCHWASCHMESIEIIQIIRAMYVQGCRTLSSSVQLFIILLDDIMNEVCSERRGITLTLSCQLKNLHCANNIYLLLNKVFNMHTMLDLKESNLEYLTHV